MSHKQAARLCGRIAIVTASTEGIGFAIAQRLAEEGAKVIISSRKKEKVDKALNKLCKLNLNVWGLECHVANAIQRKNLFDEACKLGGLDILVSNAGVNLEIAHVLDSSEKIWDKVFEVNVKASFLLAKEALPLLRKSKAGRILFISSIYGIQPHDLLGVYSVSKTALLGLTKAASVQLAVDDITVNSVCPGIIQTKFSSALTSQDNVQFEVLNKIPMGRLGQPKDVAALVAFLASDEASFVTGENYVIAGGMASRL